MTSNSVAWIACIIFTALIAVVESQTWTGNIVNYQVWEGRTCRYCICQYRTYCGAWRNFRCNTLVTKQRCASGWRHNGNRNCNIPICRSGCGTVGVCIGPGECDCRDQAIGRFCQTLVCSFASPCYPGSCYDNNKCNCTAGFTKITPSSKDGCLKMDTNNTPFIGKSTTIIEHIRRADGRFLFNFFLDASDTTPEKLIVWSNQRIFNQMHFYFEVTYEEPEYLPDIPLYVHETKVGITKGRILLRVLDFKNDVHSYQQYDIDCSVASKDNPQLLFNCTKRGEAFKPLIEHADTLRVTFEATNGGYRQMIDDGSLLDKDLFLGQTSRKNVYFKFDFQAPKHCSENAIDGYTATNCENSTMLEATSEFTKEPISVHWKGWTDDRYGSQMWMYYLELHKLVVEDATLQLTERDPIGPMDRNQTLHMGQMTHYQTFTPKEPGMYSVLLEVRDIANNSRIARRFILYDNVSDVQLNQKSPNGLHVSSAENRTDYQWQSQGVEGGNTDIVVKWTGYFMNKAHEDGYYNNEIKTFKPQFEDLEDDGVLFTRKFVDPALDDNEGERTRDPIANIHGIVKFEYQYTTDIAAPLPGSTWTDVLPLSESTTIREKMSSGDQLKIWVRALDVLGNNKTASTIVTTDFTKPYISDNDDNKTTYMLPNSNAGPFNYSSSLFLEAFDTESGVREIGVNITIKMPGVADVNVMKFVNAHTDDKRHPDRDDTCVESKDKSTCFLKDQTVIVDNCWLTVPNQLLLPAASATIEVIAYNQAMLSRRVSYEIDAITDLNGLIGYTGPESAKVVNVKPGSFRIVWEFPTIMSCYTIQTTIILVLFKQTSDGNVEFVTHTIPGSAKYFDIANLDADTKYILNFISKIGEEQNSPLQLVATTAKEPVSEGIDIDECSSNPCKNNGLCTDGVNMFACECYPGYEGILCEVDIDDCIPSACKNGGTCQDRENGYTCTCVAGFFGVNCSTEINECLTNPCANEGTCEDNVNGRICHCNEGYEGTNCEIDIYECLGNPCKNGGSCKDLVNKYECVCAPGYDGSDCENELNECSSSPCKNGAICNDLVNEYECTCEPGYDGTNCDNNVNECYSNPCKNGATCNDLVNKYECTCVPGYDGTNCDNNKNECSSNPCKNGATCSDLVNGYECTCMAGFEGNKCDIDINECLKIPCKNGGSCKDLVNKYECVCTSGFDGSDCENDIDECSSNPCKNGGKCKDLGDKYECTCVPSYDGTNCDDIAQTTTKVPASKSARVTVVMIFPVKSTINTADPNLKEDVKLQLMGIYRMYMGEFLIDVVIISLRIGSLRVDFDLIYNNETLTASQDLTDANKALLRGQKSIQVLNETVSATSLQINNITVTNETVSDKESLCNMFEALNGKCMTNQHCSVENETPSCVFNVEDEKFGLTLVIVVVVCSIFVPVITVIIVCVTIRKIRNKHKLPNTRERDHTGFERSFHLKPSYHMGHIEAT